MARQAMSESEKQAAADKRNALSLGAKAALADGDWKEFCDNELCDGATFVYQCVKETFTSFDQVKELIEWLDDAFAAMAVSKSKTAESRMLMKRYATCSDSLGRFKPSDFDGTGKRGKDPSKNPRWGELPEVFGIKRDKNVVIFRHLQGEKKVIAIEYNGEEIESEVYESMAVASSDPRYFGEGCYKSDGWSIARHVTVEDGNYVVGDKIKFTVSFEDTDFSGSEIMDAFTLALKFKGQNPDSIGDVSEAVKVLFAKFHAAL